MKKRGVEIHGGMPRKLLRQIIYSISSEESSKDFEPRQLKLHPFPFIISHSPGNKGIKALIKTQRVE